LLSVNDRKPKEKPGPVVRQLKGKTEVHSRALDDPRTQVDEGKVDPMRGPVRAWTAQRLLPTENDDTADQVLERKPRDAAKRETRFGEQNTKAPRAMENPGVRARTE
jgi:hypothetical protein